MWLFSHKPANLFSLSSPVTSLLVTRKVGLSHFTHRTEILGDITSGVPGLGFSFSKGVFCMPVEMGWVLLPPYSMRI